MKNIRRLLFLLPAVLLGSSQAQDAGKPLAWEDCVAIALTKNPDLASSLRALEAGQAGYHGSFNGLLPQVTLSNGYNDGNSFNSSGSGGGSFHWQAQAAANINMLNMGQVANIKSASAGVAQAKANLRGASASLRLGLRQAFAQLLFAEKNLEVSRAIFEMRARDSQLVALRYDSGRESKGNMLRAKAQVLQAQADLDQARRSLGTAQKTLDRQLGLDDFSVVSASGALDAPPVPPLPGDMGSLLDARPDVILQKAAIQSAAAALSQSWSSIWPALSANYSRSRQGAAEFPSSRYNWAFSGLVSYPLFGGGPTATYYAATAAKRNLEKSEQDLRSVRNAAIVDLESAWAGLAGAADQVKVQIALLEAARQRNDEADVRYASGLLTYDSWEIIASDRIGSERQAIQARLNAVNAEAAWNKSLGKGLTE